MRILIDILHPAHVHFFSNFIREMETQGHVVRVTARDKDVTLSLLENLGIDFKVISRQGSGRLGLLSEFLVRTWRLLLIAIKWKPDLLTGIMGPSVGIVGPLTRRPAVVMYDTEIASLTNRWVFPLAHAVITPDSFASKVRGRHVTYSGLQELAYLHPNRFQPDEAALKEFGIQPDCPYTLVRFVSWQASHDIRDTGLTSGRRRDLVDALQEYGRVIVSCEGPLDPELEALKVAGPQHRIHHLLAGAQIFVGESATMASEAALLGTPSVYIAWRSRGYIDEEAQAGLVTVFRPEEFNDCIEAIPQIIGNRSTHRRRLHSFLSTKNDVTEWLVDWFTTEFAR